MTVPTSDSLDHLREALPTWASDTGLHLVPAASDPEFGPEVAIDPADMTARQFTDLAGSVADPRILYTHTSTFDPDPHRAELEDAFASHRPDADADEDSPAHLPEAALAHLAAAEPHRGRTTSLELAFYACQVLHTWQATAPWYTDWLAERDTLLPEPDEQEEAIGEDEATVDRLADHLAQNPEFRAATAPRRLRLAVSLLTTATAAGPVSAETARWAAQRASRQVDEEAGDYFSDLPESRLEELAQELSLDPDYRKATKADIRRHRAQQFLTTRTGWRPPSITVAMLLDTPPLQRGAPRTIPPGDPLFP